MFEWVENRLLASSQGFERLSSLLFPVYKLSRENIQPENMREIVFEKKKGRGVTVNRTSVYAEVASSGLKIGFRLLAKGLKY